MEESLNLLDSRCLSSDKPSKYGIFNHVNLPEDFNNQSTEVYLADEFNILVHAEAEAMTLTNGQRLI